MKEFNFTLVYKFPQALLKPQDLVDKLEENGCCDAFTGVGDRQKVSLAFSIEASSLSQAIIQARSEVSNVIVGAEFKELKLPEEDVL